MFTFLFRLIHQASQLFFTGVALCLALGFILGIFSPGNADTAFLFQALHPLDPFLHQACAFLVQPVDKSLELLQTLAPWLSHIFPASFKGSFPIAPATRVAQHLGQLLLLLSHDLHGRYAQDLWHAPYGSLFPGVVDYRFLLALPLWHWVESMFIQLINMLERSFYQQSLRWEDRARLKTFQAESP